MLLINTFIITGHVRIVSICFGTESAFHDEDCNRLVEAVRDFCDSYYNEKGDWEWKRLRLMTIKAINLDVFDEESLRESVCRIAGRY